MNEPKHIGTGIFGMMIKTRANNKPLVKGDTFFDADWGLITWSGSKWEQE